MNVPPLHINVALVQHAITQKDHTIASVQLDLQQPLENVRILMSVRMGKQNAALMLCART